MKIKDLVGKKFGKLTVIRFIGHKFRGKTPPRSCRMWLCKCDCGREITTITEYLVNKDTKSCGCAKAHIFEIGQQIGRETILEKLPSNNNNLFLCRCYCGIVYKRIAGRIQGRGCRGCSARKWLTKDISLGKWNSIFRQAKVRNLVFDITPEQVQGLFDKQNKKCCMSGVNLCFVKTASVDRLNGAKEYTLDNIRIVHKYINMLRQNRPDSEFIGWCKQVASYSYCNQ